MCLAYPGRDRPALDGVSLTIAPGERVAVAGPSGAGKSSLLALLLRFAEPSGGRIEAGGIPLSSIAMPAWRQQIAWVPQHPVLMSGTVAANIALGQAGASRDAIASAAGLAGADGFIRALPDGYDTPLGERGLRLSAGQRQRIAIARAFLRDAPLLLLDEPVAHLDPVTAAQILDAVERLMAGRTVILVSHGMRWRGGADRTLTLDGGRVVLAAGCLLRRDGGDRVSGAGTAARDTGLPAGAHPLLRLLPLARPVRGRLLLAVLAAAAATGCGVALLGTSGFLLARASQHPSILAISGAVVAVRAFSVGRGVFRYAERVSSHDVAFRVLADLRVRVYRRLERLAPAGLHAFRSGDLLARLVSDVDATQELFLRGIGPPLAAAVVAAGAVAAVWLLLSAPAGIMLAAGMAAGGLLVPWLAFARARRVSPPYRQRTRRVQRQPHRRAGRGGRPACVRRLRRCPGRPVSRRPRPDHAGPRLRLGGGPGGRAGAGVAGVTLWVVLLLGVAAVAAGPLSRVPLAAAVLTALAAFEAVAPLPTAAISLGQARAAAARVAAVLDAPEPVTDPGGAAAAARWAAAGGAAGRAGALRPGRAIRS